MKILHIFSSKVFAGLERHVEELAFEQSKENSVLVIGPVKFEEQFRANYKAINMNQWRWSPFLNFSSLLSSTQFSKTLFFIDLTFSIDFLLAPKT